MLDGLFRFALCLHSVKKDGILGGRDWRRGATVGGGRTEEEGVLEVA